MALKAKYKKKDDIPQALREHYKEQNGEWVLDAEGVKSQEDFDNYAEALKKRLADATEKLELLQKSGLSRDDVLSAIRDAAGELGSGGAGGGSGGGGGGGADTGDLAQLRSTVHDLERKLAAATTKLEAVTAERDKAVGASREQAITSELTSAASAAGVRPEALQNVVRLAVNDFELDSEGKVVAKLNVPGINPNTPPADYFNARKGDPSFKYFWPDSQGGGSHSTDGPAGTPNKDNPWSREGWNVTKQMEAVRADRATAEQLASAAGSKVGATQPPPAPRSD